MHTKISFLGLPGLRAKQSHFAETIHFYSDMIKRPKPFTQQYARPSYKYKPTVLRGPSNSRRRVVCSKLLKI